MRATTKGAHMSPRILMTFLVGLAACGEEIQVSNADTDSVRTLSRTAVEEAYTPAVDEALALEVADDELPEFSEVPMHEIALHEDAAAADAATASELVPTAGYQLRRGESLAHFARWSGVPVEVIAEASGLELSGNYAVGTDVVIPLSGEEGEIEGIDSRRDSHQTKRVEGYLSARGGADQAATYKVRTGDTAWSIATENQGIPVWLVEAYNPSIDLDRLSPGQALQLPVISDVVVDAEAPSVE